MPIAQIWEKARVSSPYILESVECNMCQTSQALDFAGDTGQTGDLNRSGRCSTEHLQK
jgi:hypothetical protein